MATFKPQYSKPYLSYAQQLNLLKQRGLLIPSDQDALHLLETLGYYRLSGYLYPFRNLPPVGTIPFKRLDTFSNGASIKFAEDLYNFDRRLKTLIMYAIERLEVAIRARIAYVMGAVDPFCYSSAHHLDANFSKITYDVSGRLKRSNFDQWQDKFGRNLSRSSEDFMQHFHDNYRPPLPIWIAIEVWDFGLLSFFYSGMKYANRTSLSSYYGLGDKQDVFGSWLRNLNYVRNVCAHHSRLWNRSLVDQPRSLPVGQIPDLDHLIGDSKAQVHIYSTLCILQYFMQKIGLNANWGSQVKLLIQSFPVTSGSVSVSDMGFPVGWEGQNLWR